MDLVLADCTGMIGIVELPTNLITKEAGFKVGIIKDTLHLSSEAKPAKLSCRFTSRLPRNSQSYLWVRKQIEDICFPNLLSEYSYFTGLITYQSRGLNIKC